MALKAPGQVFPVSTVVEVESVEVFGETVRFSPAEFSGTLLGAGETVTARGEARCEAVMACARCLRPVSVPLCVEVDQRFSRRPDGRDGEEETRVIEESRIDLTDCVRELLVLELPMRVLCSQDCKGLCPVCGADRNAVDCACATHGQSAMAPGVPSGLERPEIDRSAGGVVKPFSALKTMIERDEEE